MKNISNSGYQTSGVERLMFVLFKGGCNDLTKSQLDHRWPVPELFKTPMTHSGEVEVLLSWILSIIIERLPLIRTPYLMCAER